ncbi:MAG TPA: TonB-dependent receptor [Terriglobales bacterium]|nr:TonB-dependent receptor [Terriglobales bacterium]
MRIPKICSLSLFAIVFCSLTYGQGVASGDLHVTVKDPNGSFVTGATVKVRDEAKGTEHPASASGSGEYSILALPPASYTLTVSAPGFATKAFSHLTITVGSLSELPITLTVASTTETVEVSSQADLIETTRTSTTDTVNQQRIDNLPINQRDYINITLTDSQVVRDNAPGIGAAPTSGLNMSGQRARSNLVNVDGADATDNSVNGVRSTVSQEAVQEFQIITNGYSPEYGRAAGGVVNIVTRSGDNRFHGDVFGFLRNRNFQAVNPFSTVSNPAYTRVQAGAAFGGALKKDKTFYFFSYEVRRRHETGFASIGQNNWGLVPFDTSTTAGGAEPLPFGTIQVTPAQAAFLGPGLGQLAQQNPAAFALLAPVAIPSYEFLAGASSGIAVNGVYPQGLALAAPPPGNGSDPLKQFPSSCNSGNPLCNGLPASFLSLGAQAGNFPVSDGTSIYSLRLDHHLSAAHTLTLRANVSPSTVTGIEVNGENQVFGQNSFSRTSQQTYRDVAGVAQDTWTIGNNKVNELRFQYARRGLSYFYSNAPGGSAVAVDIPGFAFTGREPYSYIQRTEQRYQFSDNLSWAMGKHATKMGVDFNYIKLAATFTVNYGGVYGFGGLDPTQFGFLSGVGFPQFSPVQAYGLGIPSTLVQGIGNPSDKFNNKPLGVFWQDSWRFRPNLTINYGVRYDVEFPPQLAAPTGLALSAYNQLGLQKGIQTDKNNFQPRIGVAWSPGSSGKTVIRSSYGIFYDHPLLGLYFLGDASDGSKSGQLLFAGGSPCNPGVPPGVSSLNATNIFQGILTTSSCLQGIPGYLPNQQRFDPSNASLFINQNYLSQASFFPLAFQPFGYPQSKNFVYAYAQQANLTIERDLGHDFALSVAYNFNGGRHLNRPINANTVRGDLLLRNWQASLSDPTSNAAAGPLFVGSGSTAQGFLPCNVNPNNGQPWVSAALTNFFRPSGLNPAIAAALLSSPAAGCVGLAQSILHGEGLSTACDPTTASFTGCVPFSDMDANYSNGSSVYHGMTVNLRKRFSSHYEMLGSYTWSHAIDDSTDLQSPLAPQDSFFPSAERSTSLFDQRHRFVFSGVYQSGHLGGDSFVSRVFSEWTIAPIIEVASGRPFNILTGNPDNFQFSPDTGRPNVVPAGAPDVGCGGPVPSKFSPTGFFQEPCFAVFGAGGNPSLQALDGTFGRNAGIKPWVVFNDLRIGRKIPLGERLSLDASVDIFNIANKFNVADVNQLFTNAGQATAAYDPRQFQFGLKLKW